MGPQTAGPFGVKTILLARKLKQTLKASCWHRHCTYFGSFMFNPETL